MATLTVGSQLGYDKSFFGGTGAGAGGGGAAAPANTLAPVVTGANLTGSTLTTTDGTWTGSPAPTFTYQWQRGGSNIGSATASTYVLVAADSGTSIRCVVTGTNASGNASANSNAIQAAASADFELGTGGNAIAAGDAASQTAWNTVTINSAGGLKYDSTHTYQTMAAKIDTTATPGATVSANWTTAIGTVTDSYGRFYLYLTANPASSYRVMGDSGGVNQVRISSTGTVQMNDSTGISATTATISLNQWVRIEYHLVHSATVGSFEVKLFNSPDSATPTETKTVTSRNTGASAAGFSFGNASGGTGGVFWLDNIVAGAKAYPGPAAASYTFPQNTTVLDNFNRADENPPTGWTDLVGDSLVVSNQIKQNSGVGSMLWNAGTFAADQEGYITVPVLTASSGIYSGILLRSDITGANFYSCYWVNQAGTDTWEIYQKVAGTETIIGSATTGPSLAAGDKFGANVVGNVVTMFAFQSGAWTQVKQVTGSGPSGVGYVGLYTSGTVARYDDFVAGAIV